MHTILRDLMHYPSSYHTSMSCVTKRCREFPKVVPPPYALASKSRYKHCQQNKHTPQTPPPQMSLPPTPTPSLSSANSPTISQRINRPITRVPPLLLNHHTLCPHSSLSSIALFPPWRRMFFNDNHLVAPSSTPFSPRNLSRYPFLNYYSFGTFRFADYANWSSVSSDFNRLTRSPAASSRRPRLGTPNNNTLRSIRRIRGTRVQAGIK